MRKALQTLPCVETNSVKVDQPSKEARFTVKKDSKCDVEEVKQVVKDAGFTVSAVRVPKDATLKKSEADTSAPAK